MRKFFAGLLCAAMLLSMAACGGAGGSSSQGGESSTQESGENSSSAASSLPDGPVTLSINLHSWTPTLNTEPTEESPTVRLVGTTVLEQWLADKPNVTVEWHRNVVLNDATSARENMNILVNAGTAPDIFFAWGNFFNDQGWLCDLSDILETPNYYEEGNQKWIDQFPEYLWEADQMTMNVKGDKLAIPFSLYPGSSVAYFYNVDLFEQYGKSVPATYQELCDTALFFKKEGYTGVAPWSGLPKVDASDWLFWSSLCPAYAVGYESIDADGDEVVNMEENLRAAFKGMFYAQPNENVQEVFRQFKYNKVEVLDQGWEGIDYTTPWVQGEVAMKLDGLWALAGEASNTGRDFDFDLFVPPLVSTDTYDKVRVPEYTEAGPYEPNIEVAFNIMKPEIQNRPAANFDYAADFLKCMTATENISMFLEETGSTLGATKTCTVPAGLSGWVTRPFPKPLVGSINVTGFSSTSTEPRNKLLEQYVKDMITEEEFFKQWDAECWKDYNAYAEEQGVDVSNWEKVEPLR